MVDPQLIHLIGGDIECLCRKDNQIKIHGHRIELGEVEQALQRTGSISAAVVVPTEVNNKPQLSALTVFDPKTSFGLESPDAHRDEVNRLKEGLDTLPPYMLPKYVVPVGKLPTLPSGKVNRKFLRQWIEDLSDADLGKYSIDSAGPPSELVPVTTEEEIVLEQIWSETLRRERDEIGALANFFSLGGDSVSAINLVGNCRAAGYDLLVSHVLKSPVLRKMATNLKKANTMRDSGSAKDFVAPESLNILFDSQGFCATKDVDYMFPAPPGQTEFLNQGQRAEQFWVLMTVRRLPVSFSVDRWIHAVRALTRANDILRTFYVRSEIDGDWVGVVLKQPVVDIAYYTSTDEDQHCKIIEDVWSERFIFGKPWVRYAIINLPDGCNELVIKMDHAIYDGTLLRIFDEQFTAIQQDATPPTHEEFRDFALHMWRGDKDKSLKFWTNVMADKTFVYPAADEPKITAMISKATGIGLEDYATRCNVTPSIVFQTTFQLWLMRSTGSWDVAFDYPLSGRNVELSNPQLINGNLANLLPFRSRLPDQDYGTQTIGDYLGETQKLFWEITENGNVGLDAIYNAAKIDRKQFGNRALFLFQPFEPAAPGAADDVMHWVVMKGSQVRMYQPYALVVEISKTLRGHLVKIMYDESVFVKAAAERIAEEQIEMMEKMVMTRPETKVGEFLDGL